MTTNTNTESTSTSEFKLPAADVRKIILDAAKQHNLPMVPVVGNTFPVKGLIWTHGGTWDKEAKCWMVPSTYADKMQEAVDSVDLKIQAAKAASAAKKAAKLATV